MTRLVHILLLLLAGAPVLGSLPYLDRVGGPTGAGMSMMGGSLAAEGASGGAATLFAAPAFAAGAKQATVGVLEGVAGGWGLRNFSKLDPLQQPPQQPQGGLHPDAGPYRDPNPPQYEGGYEPSQVVRDHIENRARGGADAGFNIDPKPWESNARKGGFEGNLARDIEEFKQNWRNAAGREPTPE